MTTRIAGVLTAGFLVLLLASCGGLTPADQDAELTPLGLGTGPKATGDVQIVWMGGGGEGGAEKLAYAEVAFLEAYKNKGDRGSFHYVVYNADGTLHREIVAEVPATHGGIGVLVDAPMAYFVGEVTFDSKAAAAGHEGGSGDEGGCDDATDEGGCTGGDDGGMSGGGNEEEGGCSGGHEDEGTGGPKHPPGSLSRVGQIVAVIVQDAGTPGAAGDTLRWSWFADPSDEHPTYLLPPSISDTGAWPGLCEKPILGGNLFVHR